jgi:hypothetical protein
MIVLGYTDGCTVLNEGIALGVLFTVGIPVGSAEGCTGGKLEGLDGLLLGAIDGRGVDSPDGHAVGWVEGNSLGCEVGELGKQVGT